MTSAKCVTKVPIRGRQQLQAIGLPRDKHCEKRRESTVALEMCLNEEARTRAKFALSRAERLGPVDAKHSLRRSLERAIAWGATVGQMS